MFLILIIVAAICVVIALSFLGAMLLVERFIGLWPGLMVGFAGVLYFFVSAFRSIIGCGRGSVYVPPAPGDGGEGTFIHACDGPGGAMSYFYGYIASPVAGLFLLALIYYRFTRARRLADA